MDALNLIRTSFTGLSLIAIFQILKRLSLVNIHHIHTLSVLMLMHRLLYDFTKFLRVYTKDHKIMVLWCLRSCDLKTIITVYNLIIINIPDKQDFIEISKTTSDMKVLFYEGRTLEINTNKNWMPCRFFRKFLPTVLYPFNLLGIILGVCIFVWCKWLSNVLLHM